MTEKRKQIAIVDDESDLAELFSQGLKLAGFKTIGFDNPIAALEHIAANPHEFSLVITDWRMPKMNGLELAKKLYTIDEKIGVMLMSAFELDRDQLREINKNEYLEKPMHISEFVECVKNELSKKTEEEPEPKKQTLRKSLKKSLV